MPGLLDREKLVNNALDRLDRLERRMAAAENILSVRVFRPLVGEEGSLGNKAVTDTSLAIGLLTGPVEKLHIYDGILKVEGNGFEDVTGGTIYLQNKPSLAGVTPQDNDVVGLIRAIAVDDGGTNPIAVDLYFQITDVSEGTIDGAMRVVTQKDGADAFVFNLVRDRCGINELDPQAALDVAGSGDVAIFGDGSGVSRIIVDGAAGNAREARFSTGGSLRWSIQASSTAESGSNIGSELWFNRYSDAGSFLATAVKIQRSDGSVQVGSPTGGFKGTGTVNAVGVYDDNVLLTDYLFDLFYDGKMRPEDAKRHPDARLWSIPETAAFTEENRHLPTMPGRDEWEASGSKSVGELVTALWATVEQQQLQIFSLQKQIDELKAVN